MFAIILFNDIWLVPNQVSLHRKLLKTCYHGNSIQFMQQNQWIGVYSWEIMWFFLFVFINTIFENEFSFYYDSDKPINKSDFFVCVSYAARQPIVSKWSTNNKNTVTVHSKWTNVDNMLKIKFIKIGISWPYAIFGCKNPMTSTVIWYFLCIEYIFNSKFHDTFLSS